MLGQGVTAVTPNLRILHFKTTDVLVIRQTTPLPPVPQPAGGHRLIYHMLTGGRPQLQADAWAIASLAAARRPDSACCNKMA